VNTSTKINKYSCEREYDHPEEHCNTCDSDTCCDGRTLEAVNQYASTCDGCGELTMHEDLAMDDDTQLGYCYECMKEKL